LASARRGTLPVHRAAPRQEKIVVSSPVPRDTVRLKDGRNVAIRRLSVGDEPALAAAFGRLSDESRILRFGYASRALTKPTLDYLVGSVDGRDHVAFAAFAPDDGDRMVGVGRILRYPEDPGTLDVGITVADDYHGQGLGLVLARRLERDRPRPARRIVTQVAAENDAALRLLAVFGSRGARSADGSVEVDLGVG
jgi:RimJ/RimL family protein N-acetyltransferase